MLTTSHKAFGSAPIDLPLELEPVPGAEKLELRMLRGARYAGNAVVGAAGTVARGAEWVGHRVGGRAGRRRESPSEELEAGTGDHSLPSNPGDEREER